LSVSSHSSACLSSVIDAPVYFGAYVCVYICVYVYIYVHFFAVGVACALNRFSGHQCMCSCMRYTDVPVTSTCTIATHSLQGVHICVYAYICVCACICI